MTIFDALLALWLAVFGILQALRLDELRDELQPSVALVVLPALGVGIGRFILRTEEASRIRLSLRIEAGGALLGLWGLLLLWSFGLMNGYGVALLAGCLIAATRSVAMLLGFAPPDPVDVGRWLGRREVHGAMAAASALYIIGSNVILAAAVSAGFAIGGAVAWSALALPAGASVLVVAAWLGLERWVAYVPRSRFGPWLRPIRITAYGLIGVGLLIIAWQSHGRLMIAAGILGLGAIALGAWLALGVHDRFDARPDGLWFIGQEGAERIPWTDVVRYHALEITRSPGLQIVVKGARGPRVFQIVGIRHPTPLADLIEGIERGFARAALRGAA